VTEQAWTIAGGVIGGAAGYYLGKKDLVWTLVGTFMGAVLLPPTAAAAMPQLSPSEIGTPNVHTIELIPGKTIILRAQLGDLITVLAPSGWGVPSAEANIPGFLEIESTSATAESTVFKVTAGGQGQIQMSSGGEVAILSIEVM